jgi:hypothetical protein
MVKSFSPVVSIADLKCEPFKQGDVQESGDAGHTETT